jgi:hypothetical protein
VGADEKYVCQVVPGENRFMKTEIEFIETTVSLLRPADFQNHRARASNKNMNPMTAENIDVPRPQAGTEGRLKTTPKDSRLRPWLLAFAVLLVTWFGYAALSMARDVLAIMQALSPNW